MYRNQEISKKSPNDLERDESYEFTGATLKISGDDVAHDSLPEIGNASGKSAILSGSDAASPQKTAETHAINATGSSEADSSQPSLEKPIIGSPGHFFSFRSGQFERAVNDCINILLRPANDTEIFGSWLLTEVSHWDHEHERVYILTSKTLLEVKYDFIALRVLNHAKIRLMQIDTVLRGKITYPQSSLVPERNDNGIRIMWNKGQPISFLTSWNPFSREIPWKTIKAHPLFSYQDKYNSPLIQEELDKNRKMYSVEDFYNTLQTVITEATDLFAKFEEGSIYMENYVGIGAVIHNKNNFGFFKVRGKFSF